MHTPVQLSFHGAASTVTGSRYLLETGDRSVAPRICCCKSPGSGEPGASDALRQRIEHELGWSAIVPEHRQIVELDAEAQV